MLPAGSRGEAPEIALRRAFVGWQCRERLQMMRRDEGRPGPAVMPAVVLPGEEEPLGHIITVLNRDPLHAEVAELLHMARRTNDPAKRRTDALRYLQAEYYLGPERFSDVLTATFPPGSPGAARLVKAGEVDLLFDAHGHRYRLHCRVRKLGPEDHYRIATLAHNRLFNPALPRDVVVLAFVPDWTRSAREA